MTGERIVEDLEDRRLPEPADATAAPRQLRPEDLAPANLLGAARALLAAGGRMHMVYAWWAAPGHLELRYLANEGKNRGFIVWRVPVDGEVPSLADIMPLLGWYEREITDLFGLAFADHPEPQRLVLHEGAELPAPPFDPRYPEGHAAIVHHGVRNTPELAGAEDDVQLLPFGPVRAGVVESIEFLFFYVGEHIIHHQPRLFFKHRGMEQRFQDRDPAQAVVLAERISGVGTIAHALAYCQAVEAAAGCQVPRRARWLRVLLAELERLYNHLYYLGHLADTTTLKVGHAQGVLLAEHVKQINARLTGSRFLRNVLMPGGLRRDLVVGADLREALEDVRHQAAVYTRMLDDSGSFLDRLITTGPLDRQTAFDQGATGPVERASGIDHDLRRDHPYAGYGELTVPVPVEQAGDANARFKVRVAEIDASIVLMQRMLLLLPTGEVHACCVPPPGSEGLGWAESPRGALFYAVHLDGTGRLARVKIKSPSFSNWRVFPFTVQDSNMMDYAINEASFGLTVAGADR